MIFFVPLAALPIWWWAGWMVRIGLQHHPPTDTAAIRALATLDLTSEVAAMAVPVCGLAFFSNATYDKRIAALGVVVVLAVVRSFLRISDGIAVDG